MCFKITKTYTICRHEVTKEWLCKAGNQKKLGSLFNYKAPPKSSEPAAVCPNSREDQIIIEFGHCPRCCEILRAQERARETWRLARERMAQNPLK
ncbi:hypothetical protein B0T20DRAFT_478830 [Sordaria brevicollis]|uniref:Uncharacterized protein n=1 Tax=Sordaria brevicollis TaxID=83679 RepID=A0AAE0PGQ9_SORBR|nr:hypothetical protein B0T20DRAFT_478830 [Sordaria brevicollis]